MNDTPRKCLGYRTTTEALREELMKLREMSQLDVNFHAYNKDKENINAPICCIDIGINIVAFLQLGIQPKSQA